MSIFGNLTDAGLEKAEDKLGGSGSYLIESGIYEATIKHAYAGESAGGALSVSFIFDVDGKEHRETMYVTNKEKENFYLKGKKKCPLPGFTTVNDICLIACGEPLSAQESEPKVIKVYDYNLKAEANKEVPMLTNLIGKKVALGILRQIENKSKKNDATGKYEAVEETREINVIDKVFHPEAHLTVAEALANKTEPVFWDKWLKQNEGVVRNRCTYRGPKKGSNGAEQPAHKSLFG